MARRIDRLRPAEVDELGRYLAAGFGATEGSGFAEPDVLAWKYLDQRGGPDLARALVARDEGRIVGFVGACTGTYHVAGSPVEVSTLHMIDWLADRDQSNLGAHLFLRAHRGVETGYVLGGSADARRVLDRGAYGRLPDVPVFSRPLRVPRRIEGLKGWLRAARDVASMALRPGPHPTRPATLRRVDAFGDEADALLDTAEPGVVFSRRRPDLLNHLLRHPGRTISGWMIERDGLAIGLGILNVFSDSPARVGKVVECFLPGRDPDDWHAALVALVDELRRQGAGVATACGSTPWAATALRAAGFAERYRLEFRLRDRGGRLPRNVPFHVTFLEADYAYTE